MKSRINRYANLLHAFPSLSKKMRNSIIKGVDEEFIKCICEICFNVIKCNVPMKSYQKRKLGRFKRVIRTLAHKSVPIKVKKKLINQKGGSLLPILFSVLAPLLTNILK